MRACLHGGLEPESQSKWFAESSSKQEGRQHGNNEKRCRFTTSSLSQAGRAPADRQVGVGISLKRARTVGSRRLRIDELGRAGPSKWMSV